MRVRAKRTQKRSQSVIEGRQIKGCEPASGCDEVSKPLKHMPETDIKFYQPVCKVNMLKAGKQLGAVNVAASNIEPKPSRLRAAPQTGADMGRLSRSGQDVADIYYESGDKVNESAPRNHIFYHSNGKAGNGNDVQHAEGYRNSPSSRHYNVMSCPFLVCHDGAEVSASGLKIGRSRFKSRSPKTNFSIMTKLPVESTGK